MIIALHGSSAAKILFIMTINYFIAKHYRDSRLTPLLTWVFNALILFANDTYHGYQYAAIHPGLAFLVRHSCWAKNKYNLSLGFLLWNLSPLAHKLQHHHTSPYFLQYGLLLGMQSAGKCRCGCVFPHMIPHIF